mmetsp:Transcript_63916/g.176654  ORF Transcript_63916/g.176654 Transcript_63916/m.176654 type:complete len:456 (+) Transcript_63916:211-1578(+)
MGNACVAPKSPRRKRVVVLGAEGAGKTTLVSAMRELSAARDAALSPDTASAAGAGAAKSGEQGDAPGSKTSGSGSPFVRKSAPVIPTVGYNLEHFAHTPGLPVAAPAKEGAEAAGAPSRRTSLGLRAAPTLGPVDMAVWDIGGNSKLRGTWPRYTLGAEALIFVVDAHDRMQTEVVRDALHAVLAHEDTPQAARLCVFLNKSELAGSMAVEGAIKHFELGLLSLQRDTLVKSVSGNLVGPPREWHVIEGSAERGVGVPELLEWLCEPAAIGHSISNRGGHVRPDHGRTDGPLPPKKVVSRKAAGRPKAAGAPASNPHQEGFDLRGPPTAPIGNSKLAMKSLDRHDDYLGTRVPAAEGGGDRSARASVGSQESHASTNIAIGISGKPLPRPGALGANKQKQQQQPQQSPSGSAGGAGSGGRSIATASGGESDSASQTSPVLASGASGAVAPADAAM